MHECSRLSKPLRFRLPLPQQQPVFIHDAVPAGFFLLSLIAIVNAYTSDLLLRQCRITRTVDYDTLTYAVLYIFTNKHYDTVLCLCTPQQTSAGRYVCAQAAL